MDPHQFYLGIKITGSDKTYFFSCPNEDFAIGDLVIVATSVGIEAGIVSVAPKSIETYDSPLELKPILRKADARDKAEHEQNLEDAKRALVIAEREIAKLGLDMNLINAFYSHDGSKVTITFTSSEKRVNFRGLLPVLVPQLGARLELRQIANVDRARKIGGLGICGLPLCCSTFLNESESVGIRHVKNQMLPINNTKQSGPCGNWMCCLAYENDLYTEEKKKFPQIGTAIELDEGPYTVHSYNILSKTVQLVNAAHSDYKTFSLEDTEALMNGTYVRPVEIVRKDNAADLPSFGIEAPRKEEQKTQQNDNRNPQNEQKNFDNRENRHRKHRHGHNRNRDDRGGNQQQNNPQQNNNQQRGKEQRQKHGNPNGNNPQQEGNENRKHRHHHHRGHRPNNGNQGSGGNA